MGSRHGLKTAPADEPTALFPDLVVEAADFLPSEKISLGTWKSLSVPTQLNSGLLGKTPDYHLTPGALVPESCFPHIQRFSDPVPWYSPSWTLGAFLAAPLFYGRGIITNSKNLPDLQKTLKPYLTPIEQISTDMCDDLKRIRYSLELITAIGALPLAVAVYKGRLNTFHDSLDSATNDKGANGAFSSVLTGQPMLLGLL